MQIVIDIQEKTYNGVKSHPFHGIYSGTVSRELYHAVKDGTPLNEWCLMCMFMEDKESEDKE